MQNYFELFDLPVAFALDLNALDKAYYEVQGRVHPDKFSAASNAEKRLAMQWATLANEAYQTLKHPLNRAVYLCEMEGINLKNESSTPLPADFLMQQMAWREQLEEAQSQHDESALIALEAILNQHRSEEIKRFDTQYSQRDYTAAAMAACRLMFIEKFANDVATAFDAFA